MRDKLDAWLRDGGTIRVVPLSALVVAVLLGIIPMWLEFGTFPRWAPRDRMGGPLLAGWIVIFLAAEVGRRALGRRGARTWEEQLQGLELERADRLAGAIDRLCASLVPQAHGQLAPDHIQASLLQGIVDAARSMLDIDPGITARMSPAAPNAARGKAAGSLPEDRQHEPPCRTPWMGLFQGRRPGAGPGHLPGWQDPCSFGYSRRRGKRHLHG